MPAGNAHRLLKTMYDAFTVGVGAGIANDPGSAGTITPTMWGQVFPIVTAGVETRTLAQPTRAGVQATVCLSENVGDLTLTVTGGYNNDDDTTITFDDAGDFVTFTSIQEGTSYFWRVIAQEGTTAVVEEGVFDSLTVTSLNYNSVSRTATADGTGDGTIADAGMLQFVAVTSAGANNIIVLPTPTPGTIIILYVGANGCELRSSSPTTIAINGGTGSGVESAIAATQMAVAICTSATTWHALEITAATLTAVEAAA